MYTLFFSILKILKSWKEDTTTKCMSKVHVLSQGVVTVGLGVDVEYILIGWSQRLINITIPYATSGTSFNSQILIYFFKFYASFFVFHLIPYQLWYVICLIFIFAHFNFSYWEILYLQYFRNKSWLLLIVTNGQKNNFSCELKLKPVTNYYLGFVVKTL